MRGSIHTAVPAGLASLVLACSGCASSYSPSFAPEVGRSSRAGIGAGGPFDNHFEYGSADPANNQVALGAESDLRQRRRPRGSLPFPFPVPGSWSIPQGWSLPPTWPFPSPGPAPGKQRIPSPSTGAPAAVAYARSKLGLPYCWGGSGPGCYDCSGLTSASWKAGGKVIPRTSEGQAEGLPEVPLTMAVPGDILWRQGHVALYIGDGQVIQAPHTGDVVKVSPAVKFSKALRP